MGYFNLILYFIKSFIRIFVRKFFWFILIFICLFLGFIIFSPDVKAVDSNYSFYDTYFNDNDISTAHSKIGDTIWNNNDYDIYLIYDPNEHQYKEVFYFDSSSLSNDTIYRVDTSYSATHYGMYIKPFWFYNSTTETSVGNTVTNYNILSLYNDGVLNQSYSTFAPPEYPGWGTNLYADSSYRIYLKVIRSHFDFVDINGDTIFSATNPRIISPYFVTTKEQLETYDFDYLQINGGTTNYTNEFPQGFHNTAEITLTYVSQNIATNIDITNFLTVSNNKWSINVPYNYLTNNTVVRNGNDFLFKLEYKLYGETGYIITRGGTYNLTTQQEQDINEDSNKQVQADILDQQKDTNNKLSTLDNTINDSSVDDITSDTLPSDSTTDITSEGVNGIFTSIYNAFCTGQAQDIVFPIPFTDKSITLQANYVSSMLTSSGATWVITIIQAFWWYIISRFIIKDIMNKINKIKSGNIEEIETTNIRGDML